MPDKSQPVNVGLVTGPHGTSGQLRIVSHSDVPDRFHPGRTVIADGTPRRIISAASGPKNQLILKLEGVDSLAIAQDLTGHWLTALPQDSPQLPDQEFFHYQLLGLAVKSEEGECLGSIREIIETGSNDVYLVEGDGKELLIPAISQVIKKVDLSQGLMVVKLLEGMR